MSLTRLLETSDGYFIGRNPEVLLARGAFPCAIVAIYERISQNGVLGHFSDPSESQYFKEMLDWITGNLQPSRLEVTLTGVGLMPQKDFNPDNEMVLKAVNDLRMQKRGQLVSYFLQIGVKRGKIAERFAADNMGTDVRFDIGNGKVGIDHYDIDELLKSYASSP